LADSLSYVPALTDGVLVEVNDFQLTLKVSKKEL